MVLLANGCSTMLQHPIPCKDSLKAGRGNSEPSFIEHIMSFQPKCHALCWGQVMKATEISHTKLPNIPKLCCCPDCSNLYLIPMEHLPEASGHHLMHNRVASSQQHHLPQGDHPPTMLERSRRYAYSTHEHDLCISFLWVSLVSFSGWVLLWHLNMVVVQNSFFSKRPFLAEKKFTLAKLSPYSQKTFAGPYVGLYLGIFVRKQKLDKGHLRVWATIKTHSVAAAHSRVGVLLLTVVLAHLLRPVLTLPHRN